MTKDSTKDKRTYNITIEHDPTVCTTNEQHDALLFSICSMNTMYEASVADSCADHKEHTTR